MKTNKNGNLIYKLRHFLFKLGHLSKYCSYIQIDSTYHQTHYLLTN